MKVIDGDAVDGGVLARHAAACSRPNGSPTTRVDIATVPDLVKMRVARRCHAPREADCRGAFGTEIQTAIHVATVAECESGRARPNSGRSGNGSGGCSPFGDDSGRYG